MKIARLAAAAFATHAAALVAIALAACQSTAGYDADLTPDHDGADWIGGAPLQVAADARAAMRAHLAREHWCAWCGATAALEVHHIRPISRRPDLAADDGNMLTLCHRCHRAVGHPGGDTRKYIANLRDLCRSRLLCGPGTDAP